MKLAYSQHEETRELPGERDNARNNARCTQARKATHGLDGPELSLGWVDPWVGLGWVGSTTEKVLKI